MLSSTAEAERFPWEQALGPHPWPKFRAIDVKISATRREAVITPMLMKMTRCDTTYRTIMAVTDGRS